MDIVSFLMGKAMSGGGGGTGDDHLVAHWDFTKSTQDLIHGYAASLSGATQNSDGATITETTGQIIFPTDLLVSGYTYDFFLGATPNSGDSHNRLVMVTASDGFAFRSTGVWSYYRTGSGWRDAPSTADGYNNSHHFDNSILRFQFISVSGSGSCIKMSKDNTELMSCYVSDILSLSNLGLRFGSTSGTWIGNVLKQLKIYNI